LREANGSVIVGTVPEIRGASVTRVVLFLMCATLITGCNTVKANSDGTSTVTHDTTTPEIVQDLADQACRKAHRANAVVLATVNKDPTLPPATGKQVTTFQCADLHH
jgi:hypothetical protein